MKIVHLFSGGLDSTVALAHWRDKAYEVRCLSINYGQRHANELERAEKICRHYSIPLQTLDLRSLKPLLQSSSQTGKHEVPEGHYTEENMKITVVPNRNMLMLSAAIAWAIDLKFDAVSIAAHSGDRSIYPDCRPEFIEAVHRCAQICDWHPVKVLSPFINMTKTEIVKRGLELDVPFKLTWSCYKGGNLHCGKCGTCVERKESFQLAGVSDPTIYESSL